MKKTLFRRSSFLQLKTQKKTSLSSPGRCSLWDNHPRSQITVEGAGPNCVWFPSAAHARTHQASQAYHTYPRERGYGGDLTSTTRTTSSASTSMSGKPLQELRLRTAMWLCLLSGGNHASSTAAHGPGGFARYFYTPPPPRCTFFGWMPAHFRCRVMTTWGQKNVAGHTHRIHSSLPASCLSKKKNVVQSRLDDRWSTNLFTNCVCCTPTQQIYSDLLRLVRVLEKHAAVYLWLIMLIMFTNNYRAATTLFLRCSL